MKLSIILGNIITMDEKRPYAKAAVVKNGVFAGDDLRFPEAEVAKVAAIRAKYSHEYISNISLIHL